MPTPYLWRRATAGGAFAAMKRPPLSRTGQAWYDWYLAVAPNDPNLVYVPIPLLVRAPFALAIIVWGARTNRHWTIPVAMTLAMPILWINAVTILVAIWPMLPAGADSPAGRWLRGRAAVETPGLSSAGALPST